MCGRYSLITSANELKERFKVKKIEGSISSRFNAAPGQQLPLISNQHSEKIIIGEWGLIPAWMKDEASPKRLINARAETITEKKTFKKAVEKQRCLIIADGFYEWAIIPDQMHKQPYYITLKDGQPFAMAGIYNIKKDKNKEEYLEFAIITVEANTLMARIHNRMPAILKPEDEAKWLDNDTDLKSAIKALKSFPANKMQAYPIGLDVNSVRNDNPSIIQPLKDLPTQKPLF